MTTLNDVCDFVRGPFGGSLKKEIFVKDGYKVYEQKNAIQNDFTIGRYCIDEAKFNEMKRFEVFPDDLIISCSGTMGKIAIAPKNIKRGIINQALLKLTPNTSKTSAFFIKLWLETEFIQTNYFRDNSGAAIQNVSSVKYLKEIPFPDISLSEQEEIANQIQQHLKNIDALESEIKIEQSSINDIVKSISHIEKEYKIKDEKLSIAAEE
jgi:restriction endonuclease S subunit